jgi:hypothetical protein
MNLLKIKETVTFITLITFVTFVTFVTLLIRVMAGNGRVTEQYPSICVNHAGLKAVG